MRLFKPNVNKLSAAKDVSGLRATLRHNDPRVRAAAARALVDLKSAEAIEALSAELGEELTAKLAVDAALEQLQEHKLAPGLPRGDTTAEALGLADRSRVVDVLLARLGDSALGYHERRAVIALLGAMGDKRAVDPLLAALGGAGVRFDQVNSRSGWRGEVIVALQNIGDARAAAGISKYLSGDTFTTAARACTALGDIPDDKPFIDWALRFGSPGQWSERVAAIDALAMSRTPEAIEALVAVMLAEDLKEQVRTAAQEALIRIGSPAIAHLVPKLCEPHLRSGVRGARTVLERILEREGEDLREEDLVLIAGLGEVQGIVHESRLNALDDTYDIAESTEPIDFSSVASRSRTRLTRS